jgi:hypothetical protein
MPQTRQSKKSKSAPNIKPIPFGERPESGTFNASELVALDDSVFLFCDNNIGDTLFELRLNPDGSMAGPLVKRPLAGLEPGTVDDLEGMTHARTEGRSRLFAVPSLCLKRRKGRHKKRSKRGKECAARNGLLRITFGAEDRLEAERMPEFREWLVTQVPELGKSPRYLPDDGGLNVEGLGWSSADDALLLGVRTPVFDGRPLILRVRIKQLEGPWNADNLEMLPAVTLAIDDDRGEQGIRTIGSDRTHGVWLVVVGNSTSHSQAPFDLYAWDGNDEGKVRRLANVRFHKRMKVEGVTHGKIGGRGAVVFVDDAGGYQILWDDDPRLK